MNSNSPTISPFRRWMCTSLLLLGLSSTTGFANEWPMWRFDAQRSAHTPHELPTPLELAWSRQLSPRVQTWDDPLNNDLMPYDKFFEPIIVDGGVIVAFNDSDKVVRWNLVTGAEEWRFYTDGPVRFPPAAYGDRVFCVSDDGHLYALNAGTGRLEWKFRGGPSARKVLGNRRVISMWPARGGPVVRDGQVYFAASIWPFMGTFLYALDAESGAVTWANDGTSAMYIKQPHSAAAFAGIAPQGALAATEEFLIVPGGRSVPAVFERSTGAFRYFHLNAGGKGTGGSFVMADDQSFYVHTRKRGVRRFDLQTGKKDKVVLNEPVLDGDLAYSLEDQRVRAVGRDGEQVWEHPLTGGGDLIQAGTRLYASGTDGITVLQLPTTESPSREVQQLPLAGEVVRLAAGENTLVAVTLEGQIAAFRRASPAKPHKYREAPPRPATAAAETQEVSQVLAEHDAKAGYGLVYGVSGTALLDQLLAASELDLIAVTEKPELVDRLRRHYDGLGLYGRRVTVHLGSPQSFRAPPYVAHFVAFEDATSADPDQLAAAYASVRPYGGLLYLANTEDPTSVAEMLSTAKLPQAVVEEAGTTVLARREGPLPGSAPWTHLYGNAANTVKSNDRLVRAPLGLLWFGGNSHDEVLPRHSHAPSEQVIGGRLFVEGMNSLTARDVYTGRVLWTREFRDLGTFGVYYDETYKNTPLNPAYNQVHIPGANARGTNFVATRDRLYLAVADHCYVLAAATGETEQVIQLPPHADGRAAGKWTYLAVIGDLLLAGADYADYTNRFEFGFEATRRRGTAWSPDLLGTQALVAMDRHTGQPVWQRSAQYSFLHNAIVAGDEKVFLLDRLPDSVERQLLRRGKTPPSDYQLLALQLATGQEVWRQPAEFGTWLGYSAEHDVVIQAGSAAPDRAPDEEKRGIRAVRGSSGEPIWENRGLEYVGPCILHGDLIITNSRSYQMSSGVFHLLDGTPVLIENPITGEAEPWRYQRTYGCNTAVASEFLLTFRSGAAGYYDLESKSGVGNLGGFRSGCSSNLIVADGVLNAPDFTRTCSCSYQNQTSLALVHMPDVETWAAHSFASPTEAQQIKQIGINFGAPGSRRAPDGMLWAEYPAAATEESPLKVELGGEAVRYYNRHSSVVRGELPWVASSGVAGAERLKIALPQQDPAEPQSFTLRLHFAEPEADGTKRNFGIAVQGNEVAKDFNIAAESGGQWRHLVREFTGVLPTADCIEIELTAAQDEYETVLSGFELIAE